MKSALTFAATALAALFLASAASADSIDLPPGSVVTLQTHSATIALSNNLRGTFNCSCSAGRGSCTVDVGEGSLTCSSATGETCTGSCRFSSGPPGFRGAMAAARAHAASESHIAQ
jgi:hypothetical protein